MFGKSKKQTQAELLAELEKQRLEEEAERQEKLRREIEEAEAMAAEALKNNTPYRFSTPDPMPKELVSVLKEMLKKLFPDAKKAYLVYTQYEEKAGYLLVVDIDAKFLKIINIYLDGETKRVRNGLPIECILYSKSGSLTEGMKPFYYKEVADTASSVSLPEFSVFGISSDFSFDDVLGFEKAVDGFGGETTIEEKTPAEDEIFAEEEIPAEEETFAEEEISPENEAPAEEKAAAESQQIEFKIDTDTVKVKPETKMQLFALMNRAAKNDSEEVQLVARSGFGEFEFYIPYTTDDDAGDALKISDDCPNQSHHFLLINRDSGIKAAVLFTDSENALEFAKERKCQIAKMRYVDYKTALANGIILSPAAEGLVINPDVEQILLPPDYPLL